MEVDPAFVSNRIPSIPPSRGNKITSNTVGLRSVFCVPLGAGEAAGVGDVFGGAAVLAAEGLVGVRVLNGFIGCKCQVPGGLDRIRMEIVDAATAGHRDVGVQSSRNIRCLEYGRGGAIVLG